MERQSVSSTSIASIGYDKNSETLEVEFIKSGVYQYYNVPLFMFERLISSDSIGSFINKEIKPPYSCSKM
ncbi:KTSC domain-containing protein [Inquilinus ginsengisoli]|uniref:KTSC domain-containing protein n=1 Tax=Inquilinus ginsengisoli TaxID=363840 RepID=UPI003D21B2CA